MEHLLIIFVLIYEAYFFKLTDILDDTNLVKSLVNEYNDSLYLISSNENKSIIMNIYNSKSLNKNEYMALTKANNIEAIFGGDYSEYLLVFYENVLKIYKDNNVSNCAFNINNNVLKGTLKKIGSSYFYVSSNYQITKLELNFENIDKIEIKYNNSINFPENIKNISSVSCDYSRDYKYYLCSYFYGSKNFGISVFSNELKLINNYQYNTNFMEENDYFNKIVYLKDKNKFISINSENNNIIRLRYLEIDKNGNLQNILNIKNNKNDYIDINGTQSNPYISSNDLISLESDKIIKIFTEESKDIIFSKIQFYNDDTILTVKTTKMSFDKISSFINPKLIIWKNSLIVTIGNKEEINSNYKVSFFSLGYPNANEDKIITENKNFNLLLPKMDQNFFSLKLYYKILSIPEGFKFLNVLNNKEIKVGNYLDPEIDKISIKQYQKRINASLAYQIVSVGEFYNTSYEIFPKNEKDPSETKIISAGDCGHIYIYINFCNNGFYDVENESDDIDDIEICSKMTPKGYYLNKDDYKYTFKKCHPYCSECITGSNDDSNMKCLGCINGFEYDDKTFNCYNILGPKKPEEIKKKINKYFWVFLFIFLLAIFLTIFLIWNDIFIKPKIKNNNIEEQQNLIEQKVDNLMIKLI